MGLEDAGLILATDCGSTTTKAILVEKRSEGYRLAGRGEAPTTVEAPFDDVTIGVLNATSELEETTRRKLLNPAGDGLLTKSASAEAELDLYVSTSSAGGGLQMMVAGVVGSMTGESAQRAALGAGAIVMDVISVDDGRSQYERVELLRSLRPDMVLLAGGTDGGTIVHVAELAETLVAAKPTPRFGLNFRLPLVYAGNVEARDEVQRLLAEIADVRLVANLRPALDSENLGPAREAIHELFLDHVMQQAPGYPRLTSWVAADIMPTPSAVGYLVQLVAEAEQLNVLAVDIGGATTDVFSVFNGNYTRTVSANLGMSYSIQNVVKEAGIDRILRWLPFETPAEAVRTQLKNKMIRPTTIPQRNDDLLIEQAVAREALRLALDHHNQLAVSLKGIQQIRTIGEALTQEGSGRRLVDMNNVDLLIGSGGVLSHAPRRWQAALMLIDAFEPAGFTRLAVDSIFMMPQLGVLASVHREAALEVFERDCLLPLGAVIAPFGVPARAGVSLGKAIVTTPTGAVELELLAGELQLVPPWGDGLAKLVVEPGRKWDVGAGPGHPLEVTVEGGQVGLIFDCRGRPLVIPESRKESCVYNERSLVELARGGDH